MQRTDNIIRHAHRRKLVNLGTFDHDESHIDKNRWVVNLSERQLNAQEIQVLRNGLNFASTPKSIPTQHILAKIETGIYNLPENTKESIRASVVNILKYSKHPKTSNISKEQKSVIRNLKKDKSVMVLPADKGKAVVVINTDDYNTKMNDLLCDQQTYLKITDRRRNPTSKAEKDLNQLLREIKARPSSHDPPRPQIDEHLYRHLHSTDANPARFYGLPKIHKPDIPLRPITSCINFPTYALSKHLVIILSPLLNRNYSIRNSVQFVQHIKDQRILEDEVMVSFDVVSLFTSIPIELALQVVQLRLEQDDQLPHRTDISITNILRLLEFTLRNSFFTYDEQNFQQISGCAMGSPISATIAELVMEHVEHAALSTAEYPPRWWYRYVDDSHSCLKRDYVQQFHDHLNSIDQNIQFTIEIEQNNCLPFLDTQTIRKKDRIITDIYRKPTHTDKYLDFASHHPIQHKRSVVNTLLERAEKIPSTNAAKRREKKFIFKVLRDNGYPTKFIHTCINNKRRSNTSTSRQPPFNQDNTRSLNPGIVVPKPHFITLPYVIGVSEKISRVLTRENIKVGFKPIDTLGHLFPKPKDKLKFEQTKGIVYKIQCADCDFTYYGQTERSLKTRVVEHKRAVSRFDKFSKIAKHVEQCDHKIDFDNTTIVDKERNYHERLFLEAWYSQKNSYSGNDHIDIPIVYKALL